MRSAISIATLLPQAAREVAAVEAQLHRPENREGEKEIRQILENAQSVDANLSVGFFNEGQLIGYLLAYINEDSHLDEVSPEGVVYLHDLAILESYRSHIRQIVRFLDQAAVLVAPGLPVEAHFHAKETWLVKISSQLLERHGYRLVNSALGRVGSLVDERLAVRWEPQRLHPVAPVPEQDIDSRGLAVEIVTNTENWRPLKPEWDALVAKIPGATIFHTFDYQWSWWQTLGTRSHLFLIVVRSAGRVVGIAPFEIRTDRYFGRRLRELRLLGTPWEVDRARWLTEPGLEEVPEAIIDAVLGHRSEWDVLILWEQAKGDAVIHRFRDRLERSGLLTALSQTDPAPNLSLTGTWTDYFAGRSRKMRKNLRRSRRQLEARGRLECVEIRSWPEVLFGLSTYAAIEKRSWKPKARLGITREPGHYRFIERLASCYGSRGRFDIRILRLDDQALAATFGLRHDNTYYSLRIVHDEAFAQFSPGTLLEAFELESLFESDLEVYDFLGGFLSNKLRWTDSLLELETLHAFRRTWRLRLFHFVYFRFKSKLRAILIQLGMFATAKRLSKRVSRRLRRYGVRSRSQD